MTDTITNKNPKKITLKIYPLDILIYQRVKYFTEQKDGFCYESNISLSKQFNRSTQRISSSIQKLIRLEYLKNDGTIQQRQLKITDKPLNYYFNKNDIDFNKNDIDFNKINATTLTQILLYFNKNDMMTLTKAIGDFNKNDNRVLDIILDINKERNKDISSKENMNTCFAKKENEIEKQFNEIFTIYNLTALKVPTNNELLLNRFKKALKETGGFDNLKNITIQYLEYLKVAEWRKKKGFEFFLNNAEMLNINWKAEKEKELGKNKNNEYENLNISEDTNCLTLDIPENKDIDENFTKKEKKEQEEVIIEDEDEEEREQRLKIKEMMKTMTMPEIHRELCRQQNEKLGIVEEKKKERTLEEVRALALKKIDEAERELAKQRKFRQEEAKIYAIK